MKYSISENRLFQLTQTFLDDYLKGVRVISPNLRKTYVQFIDRSGDLVMDGIIDQELLVNRKLWDQLQNMFSLSDESVKYVIEFWTNKNLGYTFGNDVARDDSN